MEDPSPRVLEIKINKWHLIKLKSFYTAKETKNKQTKIINKFLRLPMDDETTAAARVTITHRKAGSDPPGVHVFQPHWISFEYLNMPGLSYVSQQSFLLM